MQARVARVAGNRIYASVHAVVSREKHAHNCLQTVQPAKSGGDWLQLQQANVCKSTPQLCYLSYSSLEPQHGILCGSQLLALSCRRDLQLDKVI
jgi:hypothetical protein